VGAMLAITAMVLLLVYSSLKGDVYKVVSFSIWGSFTILAYLFSILNHAFTHRKAKKVFRVFDSLSGYLVLVGTMIPITLIGLESPYNWIIFGIFTFLGSTGIVIKSVLPPKEQLYTLLLNILIIITIGIFSKLFLDMLPRQFIYCFIASLAFYLVGLVYNVMAGIKFNHAIYHMMLVFAGVLHYFAFIRYLL
jgi:hemolysin III